jgi:hypothetical protein
MFLCSPLCFPPRLCVKKKPAALRASARCEVFPAGRRKQHASRVLHPEIIARKRRKIFPNPIRTGMGKSKPPPPVSQWRRL